MAERPCYEERVMKHLGVLETIGKEYDGLPKTFKGIVDDLIRTARDAFQEYVDANALYDKLYKEQRKFRELRDAIERQNRANKTFKELGITIAG